MAEKQNRWVKLISGLLLVLIPWALILAQMAGLGWLSFANLSSARYFVLSMMVLSSIGAGLMVNGNYNKTITWIVVALLGQLSVFLIGGYLGMLDTSIKNPEFQYDQNGLYFVLDSISGFASTVVGLSGIVSIVVKSLPFFILAWGCIGIMVSDGPDEYMTIIIETMICVGIIAVFYLLGNWIGFT